MKGPVDQPLSAPPNWEDPPRNEYADRAVRFIKSCPHTKGELRREKKTLGDTWLPWQDKATKHLFGTVDSQGFRQYRKAYFEMPKKSGKSHWMAAVMLCLLGPGTKPGAELYSAGYDLGQAMVVWDLARQMAEIRGWDQDRLDIRNYPSTREIENPAAESQYEPLTRKAKSKHGFNPFACCFDELHTQPNRDLWDTVDNSMGAWREPLLVAITNAGHDRQSICYKQREYAIANNEEPFDDTFLGVVYGMEEEPEDGIGEPEDWMRANPGVPVTVGMDKLEERAKEADRQPSNLNPWQRWQLGIWTQAATRWIHPNDWDEAEEEYDEGLLEGMFCVGGIDVGIVRDLAAWVMLFLDPNDPELVRVLPRVWCPEARLYDQDNPYREAYQAWERNGSLNVLEGERTLMGTDLAPQILEDWQRFNIRSVALDRYQALELTKTLEEHVGEDRVAGMGQGPPSMTAPTRIFEERLLSDPPKIRHNGHAVLTWSVQNTALKRTRDGEQQKPVKDNDDAIIDPVQAMMMALDRAVRHEEEAEGVSVYNERAEEAGEEGSVLRSL